MSDDVQELNTDEYTDVRIGLPLPMDITGTLLKVIGKTWPGAVIKQGKERPDWDKQIVVGIPNSQRHRTAKKAKKYLKRKEYLNADTDADITELDPNGVAFGWPEWLAATWVNMARHCWEKFPDAKNYLQSEIYDKEAKQRYVFFVAKSEGQTPHALRKAADEKLAAVRTVVDTYPMAVDVRTALKNIIGEAE